MELLLVSDVHGRVRNLEKLLKRGGWDAVLIAGDVAPYGDPAAALKVLERAAKRFKGPIIVVPGNMDLLASVMEARRLGNVYPLHGSAHRIGDVWVVGVGGSPPTPFGTVTELSEEEIARLVESAFGEAWGGDAVLLSHSPPYGTKLDVVARGGHAGSRAIRSAIERFSPRLCVCGHIHEARGVDRLGTTTLVNPGPLMLGFYAVAHLARGSVEVELRSL